MNGKEGILMKKQNYWVLGYAFVTLMITCICVFKMPDTVPVHWNSSGQIDGYGSRYLYLFMGTLGFLGYFLMNLTKVIDPNEAKIKKNVKPYDTVRNIISVMLSTMALIATFAAIRSNIDISMAIYILMGVSFVVLGKYMMHVPHNYFVGFRTPWAIADEDNWKQTQKIGGYSLLIPGVLFVLAGLFKQIFLLAIAFTVLFIGVCGGFIYSWWLYYQKKKQS